jgi:hypothetical protein
MRDLCLEVLELAPGQLEALSWLYRIRSLVVF